MLHVRSLLGGQRPLVHFEGKPNFVLDPSAVDERLKGGRSKKDVFRLVRELRLRLYIAAKIVPGHDHAVIPALRIEVQVPEQAVLRVGKEQEKVAPSLGTLHDPIR